MPYLKLPTQIILLGFDKLVVGSTIFKVLEDTTPYYHSDENGNPKFCINYFSSLLKRKTEEKPQSICRIKFI